MAAWGTRSALVRLADGRASQALPVALALGFLLAFVGYPIIYTILMSFQEVRIGNLRLFWRPLAGLDNFTALISDPSFWRIARNTLFFVGGNVVLQLTIGFALALFFAVGFPGAAFFRGLLLVGWVMPPMVIGAVFKWMMSTRAGIINEGLINTGLTAKPVPWLISTDLSLLSVTLANVWFGVPFAMILIAAGLSQLPRELYEAANLDGAGAWRRFRYVTLPLMTPTLLAVGALTTIYTLRAFDLVWVMTQGGPVDSSNIFPIWSYMFSFQLFRFGQGAAVAVLMFVAVIGVGLLYVRTLRREVAA
jgi:multiple sugar transport system permease protein